MVPLGRIYKPVQQRVFAVGGFISALGTPPQKNGAKRSANTTRAWCFVVPEGPATVPGLQKVAEDLRCAGLPEAGLGFGGFGGFGGFVTSTAPWVPKTGSNAFLSVFSQVFIDFPRGQMSRVFGIWSGPVGSRLVWRLLGKMI